MCFSPSRRTASSIVTDCQSEAVGLIVIINRTGREYSMKGRKRVRHLFVPQFCKLFLKSN